MVLTQSQQSETHILAQITCKMMTSSLELSFNHYPNHCNKVLSSFRTMPHLWLDNGRKPSCVYIGIQTCCNCLSMKSEQLHRQVIKSAYACMPAVQILQRVLRQGGCHKRHSAKLDAERLRKFIMKPFYARLLHARLGRAGILSRLLLRLTQKGVVLSFLSFFCARLDFKKGAQSKQLS